MIKSILDSAISQEQRYVVVAFNPLGEPVMDVASEPLDFRGALHRARGFNTPSNGRLPQLTAVVIPMDLPSDHEDLTEAEQPKPAKPEPKASDTYGIVVTHASGKVALLNSLYKSAAEAEIEAANWHTDTTRAVVATLDRFQGFEITVISFLTKPENFEAEYAAAEARDADSNALDEQDDSEETAAESLAGTMRDFANIGDFEEAQKCLDLLKANTAQKCLESHIKAIKAKAPVDEATDDEAESVSEGKEDLVFGDEWYALSLMIDESQIAADRGDYSQIVTVGIRYALCRYLLTVIKATIENKIQCAYDIGMIARALERFCAQVIEGDETPGARSEGFTLGRTGDVSNDYGTEEALSEFLDSLLSNREAVAV